MLDFNFAQSETRLNTRLSSYSSGDPVPDLSGEICLYVEGTPSLVGFVRAYIKE